LLEEKFFKSVIGRVPEPPPAIQAIKTCFKAYVTSKRMRDIIAGCLFVEHLPRSLSVKALVYRSHQQRLLSEQDSSCDVLMKSVTSLKIKWNRSVRPQTANRKRLIDGQEKQ